MSLATTLARQQPVRPPPPAMSRDRHAARCLEAALRSLAAATLPSPAAQELERAYVAAGASLAPAWTGGGLGSTGTASDSGLGPSAVLLQRSLDPNGSASAEARAVSHAAMLLGIPVLRTDVLGLAQHTRELATGRVLPVGSVAFVRAAMGLAGFVEPAPMTYPQQLLMHLGRRVWQGTVRDLPAVTEDVFVKPVATKAFDGFLMHHKRTSAVAAIGDSAASDHELEQLGQLAWLAPDTGLWFSEPVSFACEWRFYVAGGQILASSRYDPQGADDAPEPDDQVVQAMALVLADQPPFALDVGVLSSASSCAQTGQTVLVEANDGFALGLYGSALTPQDEPWHVTGYLRMLWQRWQALAQAATDQQNQPSA